MPIGIVKLSREAMVALLGLPEGTVIMGVDDKRFYESHDISIKVLHPDLPKVPEGEEWPWVPSSWWKPK